MKVLLVNTSEQTGGAAIAASRLMHALNNHNVQTQLLVRDKQTDNPNVIKARNPLMRAKFVAERAEIFAHQPLTREPLGYRCGHTWYGHH